MIDPETAKRWGRESEELDPEGEGYFLAGRPTPILPEHLIDRAQLLRQRRLDRAAVLAQAISVMGIGVAAGTGSPAALAVGGGFGVLGLLALIAAVRSRHASERRLRESRPRSARATG